ERPDKTQQHFVEAGEWGMAGLVPAMRHRRSVSDEAGPCRYRSKLDVRLGSSNSKAKVKSTCTGVEDQCRVEEVSFAQNVSALHYIKKRDEQQEGNAEADHDDQSHSGRGMLFYFCPCHVLLYPFCSR